MAHVNYTGSAAQLFGVITQIQERMHELHKQNTELQVRARLASGSLTSLRTDLKRGADVISRSVGVSIRAQVTGQVEAARKLKAAFAAGVAVKLQPYVTNAALKTVKDRIKAAVGNASAEVGLRFQTGAAGKFRDTLRRMLAVLSRGSYIDVELRLKNAQKQIQALSSKKLLLDVEVATGTAAKIKALLALLKSLREGAKVPIRLDMDAGTRAVLQQLTRELKSAADNATRLNGRLGGAGSSARSLASGARESSGWLSRASAAFAGFASSQLVLSGINHIFAGLKDALWDFPVKLQEIQVGFDRMIGDPGKAKSFMNALQTFAIPTPFQTQDLAKGAQQAMAFGLVNKKSKTLNSDATGLMKDVGDAAFGLGRGQEGVDRLLLALGQMNVAQRVNAHQMLQLQQVGVNAWQYLATATGKSTREVRDLVRHGLIPADKAIKAIREGLRGDFGGAMEKASHTVTGAIRQIQDTLRIRLSQNFSKQFQQISDGLVGVAHYLGTADFGAKLDAIGAYAQSTIERIGAAYRFLADLYTHNSGIINVALLSVGASLLLLNAYARGGPIGAFLSLASAMSVLSTRTDGVGRAAKVLQPVLYGLAAAYVAVKIAAGAAAVSEGFAAGMAGRAAAMEGIGAAALRTGAALRGISGAFATFSTLSASLGPLTALRVLLTGLGSDAALIGPSMVGAEAGIAGLSAGALIAGPILVALAAIAGVVAIGYEAYQAKAARVTAANADLSFTIGNVKNQFDLLQKVGNVVPGKVEEISKLRVEYDKLSGSLEGLQKVGADLQLARAHVEIDTKLKPIERSVLLGQMDKLQGQLDAQKQALAFKVECDAEANPTSLKNLGDAFSNTYQDIGHAFKSLGGHIVSNAKWVWGQIFYAAGVSFEGIKSGMTGLKVGLADAWYSMTGGFDSSFNRMLRSMSDGITGFIGNVVGAINRIGDAIDAKVNSWGDTFQRWATGQSDDGTRPEIRSSMSPAQIASQKAAHAALVAAHPAQGQTFGKGSGGSTSASDPYGDPGDKSDKRTPAQRIVANPGAYSLDQQTNAMLATQTPSAAGITAFAPDAGKPGKHHKSDAEKAAEKRERDAKRDAHREEMAELKSERDALGDAATSYTQKAKAIEEGAKLQLSALQKLRDGFSDVFSELQSHLVSLGIINDPLGPTIRMFERLMDVGGKSAKIVAGATAQITRFHNAANDARSRQEALSGLDGQVPDGGGGMASSGASGGALPSYARAMFAKVGGTIGEQCGATITTFLRRAGINTTATALARSGNARPNADGTYAPGSVFNFKGGRGGYRVNHYAMVAPDGQHWLESNWHGKRQAGNMITASRPIVWARDIAAATWGGRRNIGQAGGVVPGAGSGYGRVSSGGRSSGKIGGFLQRDAFKHGDDSLEKLVGLDGSMSKIGAIDKAWGKAVENIDGNSMRFALQSKLASKEFQTQLAQAARETGKSAPQLIGWLRQLANTADQLANRAKALSEVRKGIKELGKEKRKVERKDNPLVEAEFDFEAGGKYAEAPEKRREVYDKTMAVVLARTREETDKATDAEMKRAGALKLASPFLNAATAGTDAYQKALERANRRFEVWNSDSIKGLLEAAKSYDKLGAAAEKAIAKVALGKNVQGPQPKAVLDAQKAAHAWRAGAANLRKQANQNATKQVGAGYGADADEGRAAIARLGLEADFSAKQDGYLQAATRRIQLNEGLNARERALAEARLKWVHDKDLELRKSADFAKAYTDKKGAVDVNALNKGARTEANRQANGINFKAVNESEDAKAHTASVDELAKATAIWGDTTGLAAQKFDQAHGALSELTAAQRAQMLVTAAAIEGLQKYGQQFDALFSQKFTLAEENLTRQIRLTHGLSAAQEQELKWKSADAEQSARMALATDDERAAFEKMRPQVEGARDAVRSLLAQGEKLGAAEWMKNTSRSFRLMMEPNEIKRARVELETQLRDQGFSDPVIIKAILDTNDVLLKAQKTQEHLREYAQKVSDVFGHGLDEAFQKGPMHFFTSVLDGFANMIQNVVRQLLTAQLTKIFVKAFPSLSGQYDQAQTKVGELANQTLLSAGAAKIAESAYLAAAAAAQAYGNAAGSVPTSGPIASGLKAGGGGLFGGIMNLATGFFGGGSGKSSGSASPVAVASGPISSALAAGGRGLFRGAAAIGVQRVPFDGAIYRTHAGESILTRRETEMFNAISSPNATGARQVAVAGGDTHLNIGNITLPQVRDARGFAPALQKEVAPKISRRSAQNAAWDGVSAGRNQR